MASKARTYPAYRALVTNGELARRAATAVQSLAHCRACPRQCEADRVGQRRPAACRINRYARVASYFAHLGEENCLRGWHGSGTIFLGGCNLRCVFCQNWDISQEIEGEEVTPVRLAEMMIELQVKGCHNINWVTPEHVVPQLLEALVLAAEEGLHLPIVYNTSGYDSLESLQWLDGVVDIYMPDFKIWDPELAARFLKARDYPEVARRAIREMHRQVGDLTFDDHGLARRGVLVRHLVMPHAVAGTHQIAHWLATTLSPETYINVMNQYHVAGNVAQPGGGQRWADIARPVTTAEFNAAMFDARTAGLHRFDQRQPAAVRLR